MLDGHPDAAPGRFCHALSEAYATGATAGGHDVHVLRLCDLDFPVLQTRNDWEGQAAPTAILHVQSEILWAQHLVFIYPLWLGSMPARLKALFEQTLRPGFAFGQRERIIGLGRLKRRTSRTIVTMGMPAAIYRGFYQAHSLRAFKRNILTFVGIGPNRSTLVGKVEGIDEVRCRAWLRKISALGRGGR